MSYRLSVLFVAIALFGVSIVGVGSVAADTPSDVQERSSAIETLAQDENESEDDDTDFPLQGGGSNGGVPIEIEMGGLDTVTVTFGDLNGSENVRFDATVRDTDRDGTALVYFDTQAFNQSNNGFTAAEGSEVVDTAGEFEDGLPNLAVGPYSIFVSEGDTAYYSSEISDEGSIVLESEPQEGDTYDPVSLLVSEAPEFEITDSEIDVSSATASISVTVSNTANVSGAYEATFTSDGEQIGTESVTVDGNSTETIEFEQTFADTGTYEIAVDGTTVGNATVTSVDGESDDGSGDTDSETNGTDGDEGTETEGDTAEQDGADDSGAGLGVGSALLALAGAGYAMKRTDT